MCVRAFLVSLVQFQCTVCSSGVWQFKLSFTETCSFFLLFKFLDVYILPLLSTTHGNVWGKEEKDDCSRCKMNSDYLKSPTFSVDRLSCV